MSAEQIRAELCSLDYRARIVRCQELLDAGLIGEDRTRVLYFLAHAYRQPEIDQPADALRVATEALAEEMSAEYQGMFLEAKGMSLYDLGRLDELEAVIQEAGTFDLRPSVRGHIMALGGMVLSHQQDPAAFERFRAAERLFAEHNVIWGRAWVQLAAASLALKLGDFHQAIEWAESVDYEAKVPHAKILAAEALYRKGEQQKGVELADSVIRGEFGPLQLPEMMARAQYVKAMVALDQGDVTGANLHLADAYDLLSRQHRQWIDLAVALGLLSERVRREGVA